MKRLGLIGKSLKHSFSKSYFSNKFDKENITDISYDLHELTEISEFENLISSNPLLGLNVTIPYKTLVLDYVDELSTEVQDLQAANTLLIKDNKIKAFNTDIIGFEQSLVGLPIDSSKKALILGTGGAAKAVEYVLKKLDFQVQKISRKKSEMSLSYGEIDKNLMEETSLIVNTSPLGMYPETDSYPDIPYSLLTENHFCYDLVYNPETTEFLRKSEEQNAMVKNGLEMLVLQAEASWNIWKRAHGL